MRECSIDVQRSVRASNQLGNQHKFSMFSYSPKQSSFFLYYLYIYFVASAPRSHPANERTEHSHVICNDAFWLALNSSGFSSMWKETKSQGKYYQFTNSSTDSVQSKFKRQTLSLDFRLELKKILLINLIAVVQVSGCLRSSHEEEEARPRPSFPLPIHLQLIVRRGSVS